MGNEDLRHGVARCVLLTPSQSSVAETRSATGSGAASRRPGSSSASGSRIKDQELGFGQHHRRSHEGDESRLDRLGAVDVAPKDGDSRQLDVDRRGGVADAVDVRAQLNRPAAAANGGD